jgi:Circularly permutated YpsA SLOG family
MSPAALVDDGSTCISRFALSIAMLRLRKIISGGQTGVDRAALDAAISVGLEHGGWCPMGRLAEDGFIPVRYALRQTASPQYAFRTEQNVLDADGTLILYRGITSGGTELTRRFCLQHSRPFQLWNLAQPNEESRIHAWLSTNSIETLNVAGPRESSSAGVGDQAYTALRLLLEKICGNHFTLP